MLSRFAIVLFFAISLCSLCLCGESPPHRSPIGLALLPGGKRALTANHTSDSVSLVDLEARKVLAEQRCGRKPAAVVCSVDGRHAAVSNLWSGTVSLFEVQDTGLKPVAEVAVGAFPQGLVFSPDGRALYVAVAEEVARLDWDRRQVIQRWPAPREPRCLALSKDGRWLAAASSRSAQVRCWDTQTGRLHWERTIEDGFNLRGLVFSPDGQSVVCAHVVRRSFPVSKDNIGEGWVIDNRLTRFALAADARPFSWQVSLDRRAAAVADPHGVAFSSDGRLLVVAGSGTHELLALDAATLPWNAGDPGDFIDSKWASGLRKYMRYSVGGRPLEVAFVHDTSRVAIANYLLDAVQVVDLSAKKVVADIPLGSPPERSLARKGEEIFYDADRSWHHWFSCHTCHVDGHTCGLTFDTLNDDSYGNPKLTPSLRDVTKTGPWTWHGWQKDLGKAVSKSLTETMFPNRDEFGREPAAADVQALAAFLGTLDHPPPPRGEKHSVAAERGKAIFHGKARCARCHHGEQYTSPKNYDVKLEADGSPYQFWNPPSLRGLYDRGPYLHDGRAATLEQLLEKPHSSEKLGGKALTPGERRDLVEFLKAL